MKPLVKIPLERGCSETSKGKNDVKWNLAAWACCIVLLAANLALVLQNRQLKSQLAQPPPAYEAAPGTQVPELAGHDPDGKPLSIAYGADQRKVLIFVFSPTCGFCAENWPKWWRIFPALDRTAVRPVSVDVSSSVTRDFIAQHQMTDMPVVAQADPKALVRYQFRLTPQTILVDAGGRVEKVWSGVLDESNVAEIERMAGKAK
jgi:peroxiredoxin